MTTLFEWLSRCYNNDEDIVIYDINHVRYSRLSAYHLFRKIEFSNSDIYYEFYIDYEDEYIRIDIYNTDTRKVQFSNKYDFKTLNNLDSDWYFQSSLEYNLHDFELEHLNLLKSISNKKY